MSLPKPSKPFNFLIDHIDPLGQGVAKIGQEIFFIPKTLPGETGTAIVTRKSKQVNFAQIVSLTSSSPQRINPPCPHYNQCNGCHFLHTNYEQEIQFKEIALKKLAQGLTLPPIQTHLSRERFGHRGRMQLHYDRTGLSLGLTDRTGKINPIPECLLPSPLLKSALNKAYADPKTFLSKAKSDKGHVEFMAHNNEVSIQFDGPYAHKGFEQIHLTLNQKLRDLIDAQIQKNSIVLDLFGGDGNLSRQSKEAYVVDNFTHKIHNTNQQFISLDIYANDSVEKLAKMIGSNPINTLILDPPRSGLKNLDEFVNRFKPSILIYVSCNPATLVRDLKLLRSTFQCQELHLFDFFPGTYHFETMVVFKQNHQ